jgi:lysophospholipase L1-like esterase
MNRRKALAFLGAGALAGCGGGGGGSTTAAGTGSIPQAVGIQPTATDTSAAAAAAGSGGAAAGTTPATTPAVATATGSKNIACWGDSITNLYSSHLQTLYTDRQVMNGGIIGQTSAQINARVQSDTSHRDWVSIFWYGQNDWYKDQVQANLDASIATLQPGTPFIVVSILNWATDLPGSDMYNNVLHANAAMQQKYPNNYVDLRSLLVSRFNPGLPQDVIDHNNDETPTSLRFDTIHPNDAGCDIIAAALRDFISAKGW